MGEEVSEELREDEAIMLVNGCHECAWVCANQNKGDRGLGECRCIWLVCCVHISIGCVRVTVAVYICSMESKEEGGRSECGVIGSVYAVGVWVFL